MRSTLASCMCLSLALILCPPSSLPCLTRAASASADSPAAGKPAPTPDVLMVGDAAPPIFIGEWVKGAPVNEFEPGKVYVLDFWATWCGPCIAGMPHLSDLQRQFQDKGVRVIGVTSLDKWGNSPEAIRALVAKRGPAMDFSVAIDQDSASEHGYQNVFKGKTVEAFLGGAAVRAIPAVFVVDQRGRLAYIGHPSGLDAVLARVVANTFDLEEARLEYAALADSAAQLDRIGAMIERQEFAEVNAIARELLKGAAFNNAPTMANLAGRLTGEKSDPKQVDFRIARQAAERAVELTGEKDAGMLMCLALVQFAQGERGRAVETATRAAPLAEGDWQAAIEKDIARFKAAEAGQSAK